MDSVYCYGYILSLLPLFVDATYCSYYLGLKYCAYGCCGTYYNRYCCTNWGTIAGAVVGGVIVLGIIIFVVIWLILMKHKRSRISTVFVGTNNRCQLNNRATSNRPTVINVPARQGFVPPPPYSSVQNHQHPHPPQYNTGAPPATQQTHLAVTDPTYPPPPPPTYYPPGQTTIGS